jgi:hypothetical protein
MTILRLVLRPSRTETGALEPLDAATMKQLEENRPLYYGVLTFLPIIYTFKNPAFEEEREWRGGNYVGLWSVGDLPPFRQKETKKDLAARRREEIGWELYNMDYRALSDRIVPYRSFPMEMGVIREVVLGPRNITPILIVREALHRYGWENVKVRKSTASYR